ncbi:Glucan endo-1,3-beta-glucosidase A1 precursor [Anaerohalosphaera lusitana]|uniref:Glucan endo-1,3-beta-glucosidase A1 n=1 Tax=Anaerohalosphaera lusitana TaxID=1936003 RepID=A0A1U9NJ94_9BACT|nr:family 43 glycosylhydrolase [Anaerohalosphaera lusitana]AQT67867.1 Glucan endo-1,3-beta-glucosidase A1 precursor [Anaerohalosphaera lusitana]
MGRYIRSGFVFGILAGFVFCGVLCGQEVSEKRWYFEPGEVWRDVDGEVIHAHGGGVLFHEGVYYWFGQYLPIESYKAPADAPKEMKERVGGVSCYSSKDLYNWKFEGVVLKREAENEEHDLYYKQVVERPKVVYNPATEKFVMWMHIDSSDYKAARAGVAVSDSVAGPYEYVRSYRPEAGVWPENVEEEEKTDTVLARDFEGGQMSRDMTVFVDGGKAYLLTASEENATLHIHELDEDWTGFSGEWVRAFEGRYMEAPAIFKRGGKYYLIASGCTGWAPNAARSAVADSVMGPWEEMDNPWMGREKDKSWGTQSTFVLDVAGIEGAYIFMADIWNPKDFKDSRYVWLPVGFWKDEPRLKMRDRWSKEQAWGEVSVETMLPMLGDGERWAMVWSDEFDGDEIDESKWEVRGDHRRRDHWWVKEDAYVDGEGLLVLRTKKDGDRYTSGAMWTKGKFEHKQGYWECRAKLPKEEGHWSAFWIHCDGVTSIGDEGRDGTEIDVMEWPWRDGRVQHTLHWDGYGEHHKSMGKVSMNPRVKEGWHRFGIWWKEDEYVFYVNGKETWRTSAGGVSQVPEFAFLSNEIGEWAGDITKAKLPDYFKVDYVRVYEVIED